MGSRAAGSMATERSSPAPPLAGDERGAIGILGLFLVLLLAGLVFGILGIGKTLLQREGLQDAADAAAFASAVMHARGMNLIALINLIMAALVAILVAIRLAQTLCSVGAFVSVGLIWPTAGASAAWVYPTTQPIHPLQKTYEAAQPPIFRLLEVLHQTQRATKALVPLVATGSSIYETVEYHAAADAGFALPGSLQLPVEPDEFSVLCGHGGDIAAKLALLPLPIADLRNAIAGVVKELAEATSGFLCGDGSDTTPPEYTRERDDLIPVPVGLMEACREAPDSGACKQAQEDLERAQPQEEIGECKDHKCDEYHPYEVLADRARAECNPDAVGRMDSYRWQQETATFVLEKRGFGWKVKEIKYDGEPELLPKEGDSDKGPPCESSFFSRQTWTEWNTDSGEFEPGEHPEPLCHTRYTEPSAQRVPDGTTHEVKDVAVVTRIFSCTRKVTQDFPLAKEGEQFGKKATAEGKPRTPHRTQKGLGLGAEPFRIRAVAMGEAAGFGSTEGWIRLAGKTGDSEGKALQETLGRLGIAQAEYYFDHTGNVAPEEWMWDLRWTARLTRFRLPSDEDRAQEATRKGSAQSSTETGGSEFKSKEERTTAQECEAAPARQGSGAATEGGGSPQPSSCAAVEANLGLLDSLMLH